MSDSNPILQNVEIQGKLNMTGTHGASLKLPVLTSTMRDALSAVTGQVIWNSTTTQAEDYDGSNWQAIGREWGVLTYVPLAGGTMTGGLLIGETGASRLTQTYNGSKALQVYTTCASTNADTSWEPQRFDNVATGEGQVGCRFRVNLSTDVRLGSWANAFKAQVDCNDSGGAGGLLSVGCFEMALPTGGVGALSCLELEMTCPDSGYQGTDNFPSYIFANCTGTTVAGFQDYGVFVHFDAGNVAATGNIIGAEYSTIRLAFGNAASWTNYYIPLSTTEGAFTTSRTLTSQTGEDKHFDLVYSTDSTYTSGNIMWSGSTAPTVLKISGTHDNTEGALYGVAVFLTCDNNYAADGDGAIAVRGLVTLTDTAVTNGDVTGGFFVGKKTGSGDAHASFILYGIEAWAYISGTGQTRTAIGANVGYHADTSADCSAAGSVWRGLQVFCDAHSTDAYNAEETTGLYIWPHSGVTKNALCIGTGISTTFTTGIKFVGGATTTTGIKFGGQASDTSASNVTMTTGIDMDECASMVTGLSITATCSTAAIIVGASGSAAGDVIFYGATALHRVEWDASADELIVKGRIKFLEDTARTGEGTYLFGDGGGSGLPIGMASPGDCQGIKMEFKYGATPTLSGDGKNVHGIDIKMTMDQEWNFTSNDRNAVVRGARIQGWSVNDVGGKVMGIYSNARAAGTSKTVEGIIGGIDDGPGIVSLEARTELEDNASITSPAIVGLEIWHNSKTGSTFDGAYRAINIHQPLMPSITGNMYGIWFGDDHNTGYPYDYAFGFSSELDLDQVAHYNAGFSTDGTGTVDGWIKVEVDGNPLYIYLWPTKPS